jgi:hypothetical protein
MQNKDEKKLNYYDVVRGVLMMALLTHRSRQTGSLMMKGGGEKQCVQFHPPSLRKRKLERRTIECFTLVSIPVC